MTRVGSVVSSYYYSSGGWDTLLSHNFGANGLTDVPWIQLVAWSHDYAFGGQQVKVAFDNFTFSVPEPSCFSALLCGALGAGCVVRRKIK